MRAWMTPSDWSGTGTDTPVVFVISRCFLMRTSSTMPSM